MKQGNHPCLGPWRVVDLSQTIAPGMPVFPGAEPPRFEQGAAIASHGFAELRVSMFTHTGTHMDAPCHVLEGAPSLDQLPPERFMGRACMLDVRGLERVTRGHLEAHATLLESCDFLLLRTGMEQHWGAPEYFGAFPCLDPEAAVWLAGLGLSGVALDAISVDPLDAAGLDVHRMLLGAGMVIVENCRNLARLPEQGFVFCAMPLPIQGADGSPVRAVAFVPEPSP
jgi:arylformamidase